VEIHQAHLKVLWSEKVAGKLPALFSDIDGQWALKKSHLYPVLDLRSFLKGQWMVLRLLLDRREEKNGKFLGRACFAKNGEGLAYREEGHLRYGNYHGTARRCYRYSFPSTHYAKVYFTDDQLFHDLDLRRGSWQSTHLCREDRYHGRVQASSPDRWELTWDVLGPRKDLRITTRYCKGIEAKGE
jgi:hypothetical protein